MAQRASLFSSRVHFWAFWIGCLAVTIGVLLHIPMFLMGRYTHWKLAGMPMGNGMLFGMFLIVAGFAATGYGLLPRRDHHAISYEEIAPPEDAPLNRAHWIQIILLTTALIIDVMKAATLGFVVPGMRVEYGLTFAAASLVPFSGLLGTTIGSFMWGTLADLYGRRATILLAAVIFMGTSICGAMPSYNWNIFMCFLMGIGAGGMLPVGYALLAEIMPTRHRGWSLVLVGGIGTVAGYFATSVLSAWLQPIFGWRILWLINMPIALILVVVSPVLQESARFLQSMGRIQEARETLARFGISIDTTKVERPTELAHPPAPITVRGFVGVTVALTLAALTWGFVNYGILLWIPGSLVAEGRSMGVASALIARSTLIAIPVILITAWLYSIWSTKGLLIVSVGITTLGLFAIPLRHLTAVPFLTSPVPSLMLIITGSCAVISLLLPYAAESYPLRIRGRATGWVAGFSKAGGLAAQATGALALVPALGVAALLVAIPSGLAMLLIFILGKDTKGRDLRELERTGNGAIAAASVVSE